MTALANALSKGFLTRARQARQSTATGSRPAPGARTTTPFSRLLRWRTTLKYNMQARFKNGLAATKPIRTKSHKE